MLNALFGKYVQNLFHTFTKQSLASMKTPDKFLSTSLDLAFSFIGLSQNKTTSENGIFNSRAKTVKQLKGNFRFRPEACKEGRSETLRPTVGEKMSSNSNAISGLGRRPVKKDEARCFAQRGLPNGAYLLKISGNQYEQTTKKLLISK